MALIAIMPRFVNNHLRPGLRGEMNVMPVYAKRSAWMLALISVLVCMMCGLGGRLNNMVFAHDMATTRNTRLIYVLHSLS